MRNVEIKARVKNISKIINIARTLSGKQEQIIKQHDTFYNCNHGRLKLRKFEVNKKLQLHFPTKIYLFF